MKLVPSMKVGMGGHSIKVSHPIVKIRAISERLIPLYSSIIVTFI